MPAWIFMAFIKSCSIDSRNEQSPTCEVVHETNKVHIRNLLPNRFLPSSVGRALGWWLGGHGFRPHREQFLTIFFCTSLHGDLSDNLTQTRIVKNPIASRITTIESQTFGKSHVSVWNFIWQSWETPSYFSENGVQYTPKHVLVSISNELVFSISVFNPEIYWQMSTKKDFRHARNIYGRCETTKAMKVFSSAVDSAVSLLTSDVHFVVETEATEADSNFIRRNNDFQSK